MNISSYVHSNIVPKEGLVRQRRISVCCKIIDFYKQIKLSNFRCARRETRTLTVLLPLDFESNASTNSAIRAFYVDCVYFKKILYYK